MTVSLATKGAIATVLHGWGITRSALMERPERGGVVLLYHRITGRDEAGVALQDGMYVEPATFAEQLDFLREHFTVVPLCELSKASPGLAGSAGPRRKPCCALTFDDGWSDFYRHAYPALREHGSPATVFLPTGYIGTRRWFWTDRLAHLLDQREARGAAPSGDIPLPPGPASRILECREPIPERVESAIGAMKGLREEEIERILDALASGWGVEPGPTGRAFLDWEEVREMVRSGLVSFGSHTVSHRILTTLSEDEIEDELTRSRRDLLEREAADPAFVPFAYPNGDYSQAIAGKVREAGYALAVTTDRGWAPIPPPAPFGIPRVGIHQDVASTIPLYSCRILGWF